jgi:hypothetical protein
MLRGLARLESERRTPGALALTALAAAGMVFGLIAGATGASASSGNISIHLSNRSRNGNACKANNVDNIYVTVASVEGHRSGRSTAGFVTLTSGAPQQFDLLFGPTESAEAFDTADCPVVALGGAGLAPGRYQQMRLITVANGATDSNGNPIIAPDVNACDLLGDTVYNCVNSGGTLYPLDIPSGSETGIKIPSSQIARGGFTIQPGQGVDLDLDIDACRSLVVRGGVNHGKGKKKTASATYLLKPVLHAGEVDLQSIIAGNVVVGASGLGGSVTPSGPAVPGASVWLEAEPSSPNVPEANPTPTGTSVPLNSVLAETTTDANGNFAFCPVPAGNYDIVVDAQALPSLSNPSDATITTGVDVATNGGPNDLVIPLLEGSTSAPTLAAQVTTTSSTPPGLGDNIAFLGAQGFGLSGNQAPVPLYTGTSTSPVTTSSTGCPSACPTGTNCACFSLVAPADNPVTGAAGGSYTSGTGIASYSLFGDASAIATTTPECSPSQLISPPENSPLSLPTLSFSGCD